jgi:competence protein ComGC
MKAKIKKGFTLIEMTIVLFIISLLILIILPNVTSQKKNARHIQGGCDDASGSNSSRFVRK